MSEKVCRFLMVCTLTYIFLDEVIYANGGKQ